MAEMRGIGTEQHVLTHPATRDMELYDTVADPRELGNRICSVPAARRGLLRDRAAALAVCRGAECRRLEDLPAP